MGLIFLIGPPAVGKMAVGQTLARLTGFKLFINHDTIELILKFFNYGTPSFKKLDYQFRMSIFEEVAKSDLPGLIFTYVTALDEPSREAERVYLEEITHIFTSQNRKVYYVELEATLEERLRRNKCSSRLKAKPSKKNIPESEKRLIQMNNKYILNSSSEIPFHFSQNFLKINNTNLSPEEVAQKIQNYFGLSNKT
ncbi:AAA family ATPase [Candidatus Lokiarchaeum ossiferum]|uniref:AAA family ATPase n=1 Tax=Candidatus Lokiarchaeum ossiferum TaxID=2951803 RepID=UPI00352E8F2C